MSLTHKGFPVISRGGSRFGNYLKSHASKLVKLRAKDLEIDLGLLMREDRKSVNVGFFTRLQPSHAQAAKDEHQYSTPDTVFAGKPEWVVVKIPRDQIEWMHELVSEAGKKDPNLPRQDSNAVSPLPGLGYTKRDGRISVTSLVA